MPFTLADLRAVRVRHAQLPRAERGTDGLSLHQGAGSPGLEVGYGIAVYNPLLHPERIVQTGGGGGSRSSPPTRRRPTRSWCLERLQDILLRERVVTAYQPILRMKEGTVMGFEALSRGPRGSGLETRGRPLLAAAELTTC